MPSVLLLLALLACPSPAPPRPVTPSPVAARVAHGEVALSATLAAQDAVVRTDLAGYQRAIGQLGAAFPLPASEYPQDQTGLSLALAQAQVASSSPAAAQALGVLAVACGDCHARARANVPSEVTVAPRGDGLHTEMARHDRALSMVLDGLVRPSQADLDAGAAAFRASTLQPLASDAPPAAVALDEAVTAISIEIARESDAGLRAKAYGTLLLTCAACHEAPPAGLETEPE